MYYGAFTPNTKSGNSFGYLKHKAHHVLPTRALRRRQLLSAAAAADNLWARRRCLAGVFNYFISFLCFA